MFGPDGRLYAAERGRKIVVPHPLRDLNLGGLGIELQRLGDGLFGSLSIAHAGKDVGWNLAKLATSDFDRAARAVAESSRAKAERWRAHIDKIIGKK